MYQGPKCNGITPHTVGGLYDKPVVSHVLKSLFKLSCLPPIFYSLPCRLPKQLWLALKVSSNYWLIGPSFPSQGRHVCLLLFTV